MPPASSQAAWHRMEKRAKDRKWERNCPRPEIGEKWPKERRNVWIWGHLSIIVSFLAIFSPWAMFCFFLPNFSCVRLSARFWATRRASESEIWPTSGPTSSPTSGLTSGPTRAPTTAPTRVAFPCFLRIWFWPPPPTPEFLTKHFPSATRSRLEILTKENLVEAKTAPTAISRTFPPLVRRIRFP